MATDSYYEATVFLDYFPWGGEDADLIDNFMRQILSGLKGRMNDEHFWRDVNDGSYSTDGVAEGRHRPESSRIWKVTTFPTQTGSATLWLPAVPDFEDAYFKEGADGALFVVRKAGDANQMDGSLWYRDGTYLRALRRLRGQVELCGRIRLSKIDVKIHDGQANNFTIDEGHTTRYTQEATPASDGLDLIPYVEEVNFEKGKIENEPAMNALIYPIRAAKWSEQGTYDGPTEDSGQVHGLAIDVGNLATDGVRFVVTPNGIQVRATGRYNEDDHPILFNGIDIRNHDHSGNLYMGGPVDFAALGALTWVHETDVVTTNLGALATKTWYEFGTSLAASDYHPPEESEEELYYPSMTRLYNFRIGFSKGGTWDNDSPEIGDQRPLLFCVTDDLRNIGGSHSGQPFGAPAVPHFLLAQQFLIARSYAAFPVQLWLFKGDQRLQKTQRFKFWVMPVVDTGTDDVNAYLQVQTFAFRA